MMSGYMLGSGEGQAHVFHGASIVIKASGDDTLGQLAVMESTYPPRHGFTVTSTEPARALVITEPPRLDRQIAAHGAPDSSV